jgi:2-aminoadipate transaminase
MDLDLSRLLTSEALSGPQVSPVVRTAITFNFDQGVPGEETFPVEDLLELHRVILERDGPGALEYMTFDHDTASREIRYPDGREEMLLGHTGLRREVAAWLNRTQPSAGVSAEGVILTSGSVHAIALAAGAFVGPGDGVLVESTTFPYAVRYLQMRDAVIQPVALDADGLDAADLELALAALRAAGTRPKLIYTIATFHLPTGVTTSLARRRRILELADEYDLVVVEDSIYGDLRYAGEPVPSFLSLDSSGRVLQANGFSKVIAPGLRLGWMSGRPDVVAALAAVRQDLGVSQLTCRVMAEYLARDMLEPHIEKVNRVYRTKRDLAVEAVRKYCGDLVTFEVPEGGFYLWLRLSDRLDVERLAAETKVRGVLCRPGERFSSAAGDAAAGRHLRLAFSHVSTTELERGIAALGEALAESVS